MRLDLVRERVAGRVVRRRDERQHWTPGRKSQRIGILTSGGDCAGLNAAIRAVVFRASRTYGWTVIGIRNGTNTVGDFVMINAMMIQLYQPLNFMGMVYREIKQAVTDIEIMFAILGREPEIKDRPDAKPLEVRQGTIRFEDVRFAYDPERMRAIGPIVRSYR